MLYQVTVIKPNTWAERRMEKRAVGGDEGKAGGG